MKVLLLLLLGLLCIPCAWGTPTRVNGKWVDARYIPVVPAQEHFERGKAFYAQENYAAAFRNFTPIVFHFPDAPFFSEALYYTSLCAYHLREYDLANTYFSYYLLLPSPLSHIEEVFEYKLLIADAYGRGEKKRVALWTSLPRVLAGTEDALRLYDEVIITFPQEEIGARALYSKAQLLKKDKRMKESIETLQEVIRRFPMHALCVESYLALSQIYFEQSCLEPQNPDYLAFAELNATRFKKHFPGEKRVAAVKENLQKMEEVLARSLYETGCFYERKKKPKASLIYYEDAIRKYPETLYAEKSQERLQALTEGS